MYSEHLRQFAMGVERPCGEVAFELGMLTPGECSDVHELQKALEDSSDEAEKDVISRADSSSGPLHSLLALEIGRARLSIVLAMAIGVMWFVSLRTVDPNGGTSAVVFWVIWTIVEALRTADEPSTSKRAAPLRWPVIVRVVIFSSWLGSVIWGLALFAKLLQLESGPEFELRAQSIGLHAMYVWSAAAIYSGVIALTSWWRRWRLRCSERREAYIRKFHCKAQQMASTGFPSGEAAPPDLDMLCVTLARALSNNHWNRLIARAIVATGIALSWLPLIGGRFRSLPRRVRELEATTVSLLRPVWGKSGEVDCYRVVAIGSSACVEGQPAGILPALADIKERHVASPLDQQWFNDHFRDNFGAALPPNKYRDLPERNKHMSLAGSAAWRASTLVAPDVQQCRSFNERHLDVVRAENLNSEVRAWLRFASAIAVPIIEPTSLSNSAGSPTSREVRQRGCQGVLMVLRNVPKTILTQEISLAAGAGRTLLPLLRPLS